MFPAPTRCKSDAWAFFSFFDKQGSIKTVSHLAFSSALTCPSQLGRGTSANERMEGGAEVGGAGLYKVCVWSFGRGEFER